MWSNDPRANWIQRICKTLLKYIMQSNIVHATFPYTGSPFITSWRVAEIESTIPLVKRSPWINLKYAIPLEELPLVFTELLALYQKYRKDFGYERILPFTFRPVKADRAGYLSPTKGRTTVFVDVPYDMNVSFFGYERNSFYWFIQYDMGYNTRRPTKEEILFGCGRNITNTQGKSIMVKIVFQSQPQNYPTLS